MPIEASINAVTAFLASSWPMRGETVLICGLSPNSDLSLALNLLSSSRDKSF